MTNIELNYGNIDEERSLVEPKIDVQLPFFLKPDEAKNIPVYWQPTYKRDKTQSLWLNIAYNCEKGISFFSDCKGLQTEWFNIEWAINEKCSCPTFGV